MRQLTNKECQRVAAASCSECGENLLELMSAHVDGLDMVGIQSLVSEWPVGVIVALEVAVPDPDFDLWPDIYSYVLFADVVNGV